MFVFAALGALIVVFVGFVAVLMRVHARELGHSRNAGELAARELANAKQEAFSYRNDVLAGEGLKRENAMLKQRVSEVSTDLEAARKENATLMREVAQLNHRVLSEEDMHKRQEQLLKQVRESGINAFSQVGSKMLETNRVHNTELGEGFMKRLTEVSRSIGAINKKVEENSGNLNKILEAFQGSGRTGKHAELHLENRLTSLGLHSGEDFFTQFRTGADGGNLIADCVVMMPSEQKVEVVVIDCKSSSKMIESDMDGMLESIENMLRVYSSKDYEKGVLDAMRRRGFNVSNVHKVMYLPFEAMVHEIESSRPGIMARAKAANVIIVGPSLLDQFLFIISTFVRGRRINDEHKETIEKIKGFLNCFEVIVEHYSNVGKGLQRAAASYSKLAGSLNSRFIPSARKVFKHLNNRQSQKLSANLPVFSVIESVTSHDGGDSKLDSPEIGTLDSETE